MSYTETHDLGKPGARLEVTVDLGKREIRFQPVKMTGNHLINQLVDYPQIVSLPNDPKETRPEIRRMVTLFVDEVASLYSLHNR